MMGRCRRLASSIFNVVVSLGMFTAIMAFHLISFVVFVSLSTLIVIGLALTYAYFFSNSLFVFLENIVILSLLSFMSKYHLIFYYKLIYPGDNYERHCWSFNKKVTKLIYGILASYAFTQVIQLYSMKREKPHEILPWTDVAGAGSGSGGFRFETGIKSILNTLWMDENKYFLASMAVLVHLFSVCLYQDFCTLCESVPIITLPSLVSISYAVMLQSVYFFAYLCEFYVMLAWIPWTFIKGNLTIYAILSQILVMVWLLQATLLELLSEKLCSLLDKNEGPYYWFQNMGRGRIIVLKCILLPLVVYLFYAEHDDDILNIGGIVPTSNRNPGLFFTSFFCATVGHSLKTLMLLKNGLARMAYFLWICYFSFYDFLNCCPHYESDALTDVSCDAISHMTDEDTRKSESSTSHPGGNTNANNNNNGRRNKRSQQRLKLMPRQEVGDNPGTNTLNEESLEDFQERKAQARRTEIGDTVHFERNNIHQTGPRTSSSFPIKRPPVNNIIGLHDNVGLALTII